MFNKNKEDSMVNKKKYYQEHKESCKEFSRKYYEENKEKILIKRNKYYKENKEKILTDNEQWRKDNPEYDKERYAKGREMFLERNYQWRKNNPEHRKRYCEEYYQKNKEQIKEYRQKNKERILGYSKKWLKTNMGKAYNQRKGVIRRAREREIINTLTAEEWIKILKEYKFKCAYCGKEFDLFNRETRDHVIPISKGGDNIKENIVPACQSCNSKKSNK